MTRDEYKNEILNVSVMFAVYLRNVIVSGWKPDQLKAVRDSYLEELSDLRQKAIDEDMDVLDYVIISEWINDVEHGIDKATDGIVEFLEATDELF